MDAVDRSCLTCTHRSKRGSEDPCCGCLDTFGKPFWEIAQKQAMNGRDTTNPPRAVADGSGGAVKADTGKTPLSLLPRSALMEEGRVLQFGAQKYAAHNWRKGMNWSRLGDAAMRHLLAWLDGEDTDPETGLSHLAHLRCCAGFLIEYQEKGLGNDDRYTAA